MNESVCACEPHIVSNMRAATMSLWSLLAGALCVAMVARGPPSSSCWTAGRFADTKWKWVHYEAEGAGAGDAGLLS